MNGPPVLSRDKRKASTSRDHAPPAKRPVNGNLVPQEESLDGAESLDDDDEESDQMGEFDSHGDIFIASPGSPGEWQDTIQKVVRNVVAIRFCQTCSFDTDPGMTSEATGFVVDPERGYVPFFPCVPSLPFALIRSPISSMMHWGLPLEDAPLDTATS